MALAKYHADRQRRLDRLLAGDPPDRPAALAALRAQHSQANRSCALADTLAGELLRDRDGHDGMDTSVLASTLPDRLEAAVAFVQEQLTKAESKCSGLMGLLEQADTRANAAEARDREMRFTELLRDHLTHVHMWHQAEADAAARLPGVRRALGRTGLACHAP